jgi:repressor LexA
MSRRTNKTLKERCQEVLAFIKSYFAAHKFMPSYRDIVKATDLNSVGHLATVIEELIKNGDLEREPGTARGLRLPNLPPPLPAPPSYLSVPFLGKIAANNRKPIIHLGNYDSDSIVEVPTHLLPPRVDASSLFVLQVEGDSMSAARIANLDYVIIQRGNVYRENDIVAILLKIDNEVTLKMLKSTKRGSANLKPKSHKHHSRFENRDDIEVQGRVVAVMRKC